MTVPSHDSELSQSAKTGTEQRLSARATGTNSRSSSMNSLCFGPAGGLVTKVLYHVYMLLDITMYPCTCRAMACTGILSVEYREPRLSRDPLGNMINN